MNETHLFTFAVVIVTSDKTKAKKQEMLNVVGLAELKCLENSLEAIINNNKKR